MNHPARCTGRHQGDPRHADRQAHRQQHHDITQSTRISGQHPKQDADPHDPANGQRGCQCFSLRQALQIIAVRPLRHRLRTFYL
jgi:hypothetical protein